MELTPDPAPARWSEPRAAYDSLRTGLSPYLHYFYDLRAQHDPSLPRVEHGPDAGADLPGQMERALQALIRQSFD
ncbi:hypothetical protein [uncultured Paracoccus sp.]|uniref:hypothetical protein n=1 Tax=uncultured Paracoccus sp. TaxID=189685 RepID=UPI0025D38B05|nr:hypothetical protein [uncultured Paracoccus sp.]